MTFSWNLKLALSGFLYPYLSDLCHCQLLSFSWSRRPVLCRVARCRLSMLMCGKMGNPWQSKWLLFFISWDMSSHCPAIILIVVACLYMSSYIHVSRCSATLRATQNIWWISWLSCITVGYRSWYMSFISTICCCTPFPPTCCLFSGRKGDGTAVGYGDYLYLFNHPDAILRSHQDNNILARNIGGAAARGTHLYFPARLWQQRDEDVRILGWAYHTFFTV